MTLSASAAGAMPAVAYAASAPASEAPVAPAASPNGRIGPSLSGPAAAGEREAARTLAKQGYERFEAGDYPGALDTFRRAEEHFHAPPHWLYIARCQAKLGKLVASKDAYETILAESLAADAPGPFRDAQATARGEFEALAARVPSLWITLSGAAAGASVTLDDAPLALTELGRPISQDPGHHVVVVTTPAGKRVTRAAELKEGGGVTRIEVTLEASRSASLLPPVLAFSLGGLALAAGGATLGLAISQSSPQGTSNPGPLKAVALASFIAGGVGVGVGVTLVLLHPPPGAPARPKDTPRLRAVIGPGQAALVLNF